MLKYIIFSVNENIDYIDLIPLSFYAHRKIFNNAKIVLGVLDTVSEKIKKQLEKLSDEFFVFPKIENIPTCNQGKMMRHYICKKLPESVCMFNDVDTIPLNKKYYAKYLDSMEQGKILALGKEAYQKPHLVGKFCIRYMVGELSLFKKIWGGRDTETWKEFINRLNFLNGDGKVNMKNPLGVFSDESLIRERNKQTKVKIKHLSYGYKRGDIMLCRGGEFYKKKLLKNKYIEAHHLVPLEKYRDILSKIAKYLGVSDWEIKY